MTRTPLEPTLSAGPRAAAGFPGRLVASESRAGRGARGPGAGSAPSLVTSHRGQQRATTLHLFRNCAASRPRRGLDPGVQPPAPPGQEGCRGCPCPSLSPAERTPSGAASQPFWEPLGGTGCPLEPLSLLANVVPLSFVAWAVPFRQEHPGLATLLASSCLGSKARPWCGPREGSPSSRNPESHPSAERQQGQPGRGPGVGPRPGDHPSGGQAGGAGVLRIVERSLLWRGGDTRRRCQ